MVTAIFDIGILITLLYISFRSMKLLLASKFTLKEYNHSPILSVLVLLYPLGPLLLLFANPFISKVLLFTLVLLCYIPNMIISYKQGKSFERPRTENEKKASESLSFAFTGALIGFIYTSLYIVIYIAIINLNYSYYGA